MRSNNFIFRNSFHNKETQIEAKCYYNSHGLFVEVEPDKLNRAYQEVCGIEGCLCYKTCNIEDEMGYNIPYTTTN